MRQPIPLPNEVKSMPEATSTSILDLQEMSNDEVKRLNKHSSDINYVGIGSILLGLGGLALALSNDVNAGEMRPFGVFCILWGVVSAYACFARPRWGAATAFLTSLLLLFAFPIGTIFGILGIRAVANGQPLFGDSRITDTALTEAAGQIDRNER